MNVRKYFELNDKNITCQNLRPRNKAEFKRNT